MKIKSTCIRANLSYKSGKKRLKIKNKKGKMFFNLKNMKFVKLSEL